MPALVLTALILLVFVPIMLVTVLCFAIAVAVKAFLSVAGYFVVLTLGLWLIDRWWRRRSDLPEVIARKPPPTLDFIPYESRRDRGFPER